MALLGSTIVPPFRWRGLLALSATIGAASTLIFLAYFNVRWSSASGGVVWRVLHYVVQFALGVGAMAAFTRRTPRWRPLIAGMLVGAIVSQVVWEVVVRFTGQGWGGGLPWSASWMISDLADNTLSLLIVIVPATVAIRLLAGWLAPVDEAGPDQCGKCGYTIDPDRRIVVCPECGSPRGTEARGDRAARAWMWLQARGRILAVGMALLLCIWCAHQFVRLGWPTRRFLHEFEITDARYAVLGVVRGQSNHVSHRSVWRAPLSGDGLAFRRTAPAPCLLLPAAPSAGPARDAGDDGRGVAARL